MKSTKKTRKIEGIFRDAGSFFGQDEQASAGKEKLHVEIYQRKIIFGSVIKS